MKKIVFLASANGGNLKFLFLAQKNNIIFKLQLSVIADRECGSVEFARKNNLENHVINYRRTETKELTDILEKIKPDIIVTNWHKIIDEITVRAYKGKMINLHYSLLPAFGGLIGIEPIKRAYDQGCQYIGPTCHMVDEGTDTGMIIAQAIIKTDIQLDEAIGLMFRKGCLVLLNGIQKVVNEKLVNSTVSSTDDLSFSPALGFNEQEFLEKFWVELASA